MNALFQECLERSHAGTDLPIWGQMYRQAFPGLVGMNDHRKDGQHQRNGIDRSLVMSNGKLIWIDEKLRGRNRKTGKVYRDIALEEFSDRDRRRPGWVIKELLCDYIAYAIAPLGAGYLLPVIPLQAAWMRNGESWKRQFPRIEAVNEGYVTVSWGIPVPVLFSQIGAGLRCSFAPVEIKDEQ